MFTTGNQVPLPRAMAPSISSVFKGLFLLFNSSNRTFFLNVFGTQLIDSVHSRPADAKGQL